MDVIHPWLGTTHRVEVDSAVSFINLAHLILPTQQQSYYLCT